MSEKKNDTNPQIKVVSEGFYGDDVALSFADCVKNHNDNKGKVTNQGNDIVSKNSEQSNNNPQK